MAHHHKHVADIMQENRRIDDLAPGLANRARVLGFGGLIVAALLSFLPVHGGGWTASVEQFFRSYVLAFAYVMSIALGALFFVLIHHCTRAGWSVVVRRIAENIAGQLPLLALLALPLLVPLFANYSHVYPWSNPQVVESDATGMLPKKAAYLNDTFFIIRLAIYLIVWGWLGSYFLNKSVEQDLTGHDELTLKMQAVSAPGILLYALTVTFFSFDVLMSLAPHWFSTIFGVYYFAGCMVSFFATAALTMYWLQSRGRLTHVITTEHYHDVGKFLFAFVVFWAYIGFSQYMLYWYANMPEETFWYQARQASWYWIGISLLLLFGHFVLPFLALISRFPKRHPNLLWFGAAWMLLMHFFDLHYLVAPDSVGFEHGGAAHMRPGAAHLLTDVPLTIGLVGLAASWALREMGRNALAPERDPRLHESLAYENF